MVDRLRVLQTPTPMARLGDGAMVHKPVQQRRGHQGVSKHMGALREVQRSLDHNAGAVMQVDGK